MIKHTARVSLKARGSGEEWGEGGQDGTAALASRKLRGQDKWVPSPGLGIAYNAHLTNTIFTGQPGSLQAA